MQNKVEMQTSLVKHKRANLKISGDNNAGFDLSFLSNYLPQLYLTKWSRRHPSQRPYETNL